MNTIELPDVTVIIATYNSMHVLPRVLDAIDSQNYPKDKITVMLVDGGSIDETIDYGSKRGCSVIHNPRTEPVYAKFLGFVESKTDLIVYLDHDEVYTSPSCLVDQVKCMLVNNVQTVISAGYVNPEGEHFINDYINEYGDPFSLFVYRVSKSPDVFVADLSKRYMISNETSRSCVVDFGQNEALPLIELLAMGTLINKKYFLENFNDVVKTSENLPHLFYVLLTKDTRIGVCKTHSLAHYSSESVKKYLNKISWRIRNNIYHIKGVGASGFLMRERLMTKRNGRIGSYKKFLFIPYSLFVLPVLLDTLYLLLKRRKIAFLFHFPLCIFTASSIVWHTILKVIGMKPSLKSYDGKKEIKDD